jgi:malonyl CoA-acyl carrier protein transacylase
MDSTISPKVMYIFPGQGAQYVGMGSDIYEQFPAARAVYNRASEIIGFDLPKLCFEGPQEELNKTEFAQLALLTHSMACLEVFKELTNGACSPAVVAGHSLGEYSALVAAEALTLDDALMLVRQRGRLMSEYGRGKMAAFRLDLDSIKSLADTYYCGIGGCNLPDQTVVCGFKNDLDALIEDVARKYGKARAGRYLNTEGAFHTYLMINAAEHFRTYLEAVALQTPTVQVLSNYTGEYHALDRARIKASLFFQMFHPVRWMRGLQSAIRDGVNTIIEFGGGVGRDQQGVRQSPGSRKPNLESITRKSQDVAGREGLYFAAINSTSLLSAAKSLRLMHNGLAAGKSGTAADFVWVDQKTFCLHLPVSNGITSERALELSVQLHDMGLSGIVRTTGESREASIRHLQSFCDADIKHAEPYLEVIVGGMGAFVYCLGRDIGEELSQLRHTLNLQADSRSGV